MIAWIRIARRARHDLRPLLVLVVAASAPARADGPRPPSSPSVVRFVDPFIGVDGGGNTVPGAQVPFGFAVPSPDTERPLSSGYNTGEKIVGFSHTHVSGTGGAGKYGNFLVTPFVGRRALTDLASAATAEQAAPGYYAVTLTRDGIRAELAATRLGAIHRYTFPASPEATLFLDVSSVLRPGGERPTGPRPRHSGVRIIPPNRIEGTAHLMGGWNPGLYTLHFAAEVDRPFTAFESVRDGKARPGEPVAWGTTTGAILRFDTTTDRFVRLKLGVSFASVERAREHLRRELPAFDLDGARADAARSWQDALGRIRIEGASDDDRTIFYTALYHGHVMPHDLTGDVGPDPHYEDFYCLWDSFRTVHPLLLVLQPDRQRDIVRSLIGVFDRTGWLPEAWIAGNHGLVQGGSHGDAIIADAFVKGLRGIDYRKAYRAMRKNAEVESPRPLEVGRELAEYSTRGFLSMSFARSGTRTVEYAFNDFNVATVARGLGDRAAHARFLERSRSWRNLWDPETRSLRPRLPDGRFLTPFDPKHAYPDRTYGYWDSPFYEGSAWQYSTFVPHDVGGLIDRLGGEAGLVAWLDEFFDGGVHNQGNEPDLLSPYLYIHAGRHDRTADRVRHILRRRYRTGRAGLPGNDDTGTMSTWYVWSALGLYPSAGQPYYYIGSPIFPRATIDVGGGRRFVIAARGTSATNRYVQRATLDGRPLNRAWIPHAALVRGGHLLLDLGPAPSTFATRGERPPTVGDGPAKSPAR